MKPSWYGESVKQVYDMYEIDEGKGMGKAGKRSVM